MSETVASDSFARVPAWLSVPDDFRLLAGADLDFDQLRFGPGFDAQLDQVARVQLVVAEEAGQVRGAYAHLCLLGPEGAAGASAADPHLGARRDLFQQQLLHRGPVSSHLPT